MSKSNDVSRREVLTAGSAISLSLISRAFGATNSASSGSFPKGFLWGAATAGHQVEGNNVNADLWVLEHVKPTIFSERSGDACDSFSRWNDDLDLVREIGLNSYRFSLEWCRIEPAQGEFSIAMLDHYQRIIEGCRTRGLTPVVTFNHFTAPRWFSSAGGWEVAGAEDHFARFCERAARHLAASIGYATTLNEPNLLRALRWLDLPFPPGMAQTQDAMLAAAAKACGSDHFSASNVGNAEPMFERLIAGHKAGYAAIKSVRPDLPVGVSLSITDDQAVGQNSRRDAKRREVYAEWLEVAKTGDFVGVQNYGRQLIDATGPIAPAKSAGSAQVNVDIYPASLEATIRYAHAATGLPVLVTENGMQTTDDSLRAAYIPQAIAGVARAMAGGVPVLGYIHWSLLDNFEWIFGYAPKYGLASVDRETFKRTLKPSARVLGRIATRNAI